MRDKHPLVPNDFIISYSEHNRISLDHLDHTQKSTQARRSSLHHSAEDPPKPGPPLPHCLLPVPSSNTRIHIPSTEAV